MNLRFIIIVIMTFSLTIKGQVSIETVDTIMKTIGKAKNRADTNYVKYYDEMGIHFYGVMHTNNFTLYDNFNDKKLKYAMARSPAIGIGFNKYGVTLNLANDFGVIKQNEVKYGETEKFIINSSFIYKKIAANVYFNLFSGYYIANPNDFNAFNSDVNNPQRSDVKTIGYGLSTLQILNNKKFSLNGSYTLTQKQLKSAGSIIIGEFINGFCVSGETSLIPDTLISEFNPYSAIVESNQYVFGLSLGYSYTLVFLKDFNFNITVLPSALIANSSWISEDGMHNSNNHVSVRPNIIMRSSFAYVGDHYYIGVNSMLNNFFVGTGNENGITYNIVNIRFFAGYRIGSKRKKP